MSVQKIADGLRSGEPSRMLEAASYLAGEAAESLSPEDAAELARAISDSGRSAGGMIDLPKDSGPYADCPSTGGLGSLSTLLSPLLVASDSVPVPKISADGPIAGAIDSMRLISGFRTKLTSAEFVNLLTDLGIVHVEQSEQFCPADRVLIEQRRAKNKMESHTLAAVSLLGKKLAVPNCVSAFDFRVGPVGNIGETELLARESAEFLNNVATLLGIPIAIIATDNEYPQCSAIGRIESLDLLSQILDGNEELTALDYAHLDTCMILSAHATKLARNESDLSACKQRIDRHLEDGTAKKIFEKHLEAQGSNLRSLREVLELGRSRCHVEISARAGGYWMPPTAAILKEWCKAAIRTVSENSNKNDTRIGRQVGIRLLVSPGDSVERGQPVMRAAWPHSSADNIPPPPWGSVNEGSERSHILFSLPCRNDVAGVT